MVNGKGREAQTQAGASNPGTAPEKEGDAYVFEDLNFGIVSCFILCVLVCVMLRYSVA